MGHNFRHHIGDYTCFDMGMEVAELGMAEAKEVREATKRTRTSRESL